MDDGVSSLFLGNNRQHMPGHAKTISSWVRKVLSITKAHVSGYDMGCCITDGICGWCFPDVYPAGRSLGQSFYHS